MNRSTKKDDHKAMVPFSDPSLARLGKMVKGAEKGEFFPIFNNASVDFPSDSVDMSTGLSFVCDCVTTATSFFLHRR